jgi:DNA-binding NtrC family response regulator
LALHFIQVGAARFACASRPLSSQTLAWLDEHDWPGNIRELEYRIYQALLLGDGPVIALESSKPCSAVPAVSETPRSYRRAKEHAIAAFERSYLIQLLGEAQGNVSVAAKLACTERRHLGRLLKKHRISSVPA